MKLRRTWIDGLDKILGGWLPNKSVILIEGEPGSEHDLLAQQILYKCAPKGENVAYRQTLIPFDITERGIVIETAVRITQHQKTR